MESFKNKVQCGTVYHEKLDYDLTALIELTAVKSKITEQKDTYQDFQMSVRYITLPDYRYDNKY